MFDSESVTSFSSENAETALTASPSEPADHVQSRVLLHPHHGLCFAFFEGKGYSDRFTGNLRCFLAYLQRENPSVCLTLTPDPVCSACPNNQDGRCTSQTKVDSYDRAVLTLCNLHEGDSLPYSSFARLVRKQILDAGKRREVCGSCQWDDLCSSHDI